MRFFLLCKSLKNDLKKIYFLKLKHELRKKRALKVFYITHLDNLKNRHRLIWFLASFYSDYLHNFLNVSRKYKKLENGYKIKWVY